MPALSEYASPERRPQVQVPQAQVPQAQGLQAQGPEPQRNVSVQTQPSVQRNETVGGQLSSMLEGDSPYIQAARQRAAEAANSRGLYNSSIAAGAGERAAIEAALPIASQDASTHAQRASQNLGYEQQRSLNEQGFGFQRELEDIRQRNQESIMNLDLEHRQTLMELETQYNMELQNNASAVNLYGNVMNNITQIGADPNMTPEQRQAGINQQIDLFRSGLELVGATSDMDFTVYSGAANSPTSVNTPEGVELGPAESARIESARASRPPGGGSIINVQYGSDGNIYGTNTATGNLMVYRQVAGQPGYVWRDINNRR